MTTKATKGPWYIGEGGYCIMGNNGGQMVCETGKATWQRLASAAADSAGIAAQHMPTIEANARLIAAAPDMYRALELAAPVIDSFLNGQGAVTPDEIDEALTAINAALDSATAT